MALKKVPQGFKLMNLQLNMTLDRIPKFEEYVLRHVLCAYHVFYSKKPPVGNMQQLWFWCRPQDEVQLAYHIGTAAGSALFHKPLKYWRNQTHKVAANFPDAYLIDVPLPDFVSEYVAEKDTGKHSNNLQQVKSALSKKIHHSKPSCKYLAKTKRNKKS